MRISVARTLAMVGTRWKQGAAFYNTPVTKSKVQSGYDPACRDCPRLAAYLDQVRQVHPITTPVPSRRSVRNARPCWWWPRSRTPWGEPHRPAFTGTMPASCSTGPCIGTASPATRLVRSAGRPRAHRLPRHERGEVPSAQNKPQPDEVRRCNRYLAEEIAAVRPRAILALGAIAHRAVLMAVELSRAASLRAPRCSRAFRRFARNAALR